jgi:hypothetical protein
MEPNRPKSFGLDNPDRLMASRAPKKSIGDSDFREDREAGSGMLEEQMRRDESKESSGKITPPIPLKRSETSSADAGLIKRLLNKIQGTPKNERN